MREKAGKGALDVQRGHIQISLMEIFLGRNTREATGIATQPKFPEYECAPSYV